MRWLSGQPLSVTQARWLGLPPARWLDGAARPEQTRTIFVALAALAAAGGKTLVLAVDQVEALDGAESAALTRFLETLLDGAPGLLVATAGSTAAFERWRREETASATAWDRFAQFAIDVEPLGKSDVRALLAERLKGVVEESADGDPCFRWGPDGSTRCPTRGFDREPRLIARGSAGGYSNSASRNRAGGVAEPLERR